MTDSRGYANHRENDSSASLEVWFQDEMRVGHAWNTLINQPWKIMSIAQRHWTTVHHLL
jgi:hypothetical protein